MKIRFTYFAALTGVDAIVEAGRFVATYSTEDGRAVKLWNKNVNITNWSREVEEETSRQDTLGRKQIRKWSQGPRLESGPGSGKSVLRLM